MSEANLNVDGVTPLMRNALIAQYDAIVAAVEEALRGQQWYGNRPELKIENEIRQNIKFRIDAALTHHDPRKETK